VQGSDDPVPEHDCGVHGQLPDHLVAMVRRLPPVDAPVVSGSTPVVAFGDPTRAEVATLGINPSRIEFAADGFLLTGADRRLATLESLGVRSLDRLSDVGVAELVSDCAAYFSRNPYRGWFDPLDDLLRAVVDASYYDGTACHVDLVQWATDPVWSGIADRTVRQALLDDGVPHLRAQLAHGNVRLVLLNGRQVITQVMRTGLAELTQVAQVPLGRSRCGLFAGSGEGVRWIGWSTNLQSSWGVTTAFKDELAHRVADLVPGDRADAYVRPVTQIEIDERGHLPEGLHLIGKRELTDVLREWLLQSQALTIGDVDKYGGRAWLHIEVARHEVVLNADTKRSAVETAVRDSAPDPQRPWRVVANTRGRINKVLPGPAGQPLPGWYAYLVRPLSASGQL
jgi:hypothetical protein